MRADRVTKDLWCVLTEAEVKERGEKYKATAFLYDEWEDRKREANRELNEEGKELKSERKRLAAAVREGREKRPVECEWIDGPDCQLLVRKDTGAEVDRRSYTPEQNTKRQKEAEAARQERLRFDPTDQGETRVSFGPKNDNEPASPTPPPASATVDKERPSDSSPSNESEEEEAGEGDVVIPVADVLKKIKDAGLDKEPTPPQLLGPLADRVLPVLEQLAGGEEHNRWVQLVDLKASFPELRDQELVDAVEQLVERGALEERPASPGTWRLRPRAEQEAEIEERIEDGQRRADQLVVLGAIEEAGKAQTIRAIAKAIGWTVEETGEVVYRLRDLHAVKQIGEGGEGKVLRYGALQISERILARLRANTVMTEDQIADEAVLSADDVGAHMAKLIMQGLVVAKGSKGSEEFYLREKVEEAKAEAKRPKKLDEERQRNLILSLLTTAGEKGLTCEDLAKPAKLYASEAKARCWQLVAQGKLVQLGKNDLRSSGKNRFAAATHALVWGRFDQILPHLPAEGVTVHEIASAIGAEFRDATEAVDRALKGGRLVCIKPHRDRSKERFAPPTKLAKAAQ